MMNQFQASQAAIDAGLMCQRGPDEEAQITEAGMFYLIGSYAYGAELEDADRLRNMRSLFDVLSVAEVCGFPAWGENYLLKLFAEEVNPLESDDKGKLLATLCRLVVITVGKGRLINIIRGGGTH